MTEQKATLSVTLANSSKLTVDWDPAAGFVATVNGQHVLAPEASTTPAAPSPVVVQPEPTPTAKSGLYEPFDNPSSGASPSVKTVVTQQSMTKPLTAMTVVDPTFGLGVRKLNDGMVHVYSQLQAFSSDGKYVMLVSPDGRYNIKQYNDLMLVMSSGYWRAPRWVPNTHKIVMLSDTQPLSVQTLDVDTGVRETVISLSQFKNADKDKSFESLSDDGQWMAVFIDDEATGGGRWIVAIDIKNKTLGMCKRLSDLSSPDPTWGLVSPDWIAPSPKGKYMVVQYKKTSGMGSGLSLYDIVTGAFVRKLYDHNNHSDLGFDENGREYVATTSMAHPLNNNFPSLVVCYLDDGTFKHIRMLGWVRSEHISCEGPPGMILVSAGTKYDGPLKGEIYVAYLDGSLRRLAHHRSTESTYWIEPKASISRDGKRVIWSSDWGVPGNRDAYVIDNLSL